MRPAAGVIALEPFGFAFEGQRAFGAGRDGDLHEQQGLVLVDEVIDAGLVEHLGAGPDEVADGGAGLLLPFDRGGLAGVAGVLPVDVEVRVAAEAHRDQGLLARADVGGQVDQVDLRPDGGREVAEQAEEREQTEGEESHGPTLAVKPAGSKATHAPQPTT